MKINKNMNDDFYHCRTCCIKVYQGEIISDVEYEIYIRKNGIKYSAYTSDSFFNRSKNRGFVIIDSNKFPIVVENLPINFINSITPSNIIDKIEKVLLLK